jgi:hypothetical protein
MQYIVKYEATYYVTADNEADAVKLGIFFHEENPDGTWEAVRDPYASPLEQLADGTYSVIDGIPYLAPRQSGYWVGIEPVQSLSEAEGDYLGIWTDSAGTRFYDRTRHIEDLKEALAVASYHDQQAIWDCLADKEIPVTS